VKLGRGGTTTPSPLTLEARATPAGFWTDGGLECDLLGPDEPYAVSPNFKVSPTETIDVRPLVAWYTAAHGWRWLGTQGINASGWYRWTATPTGIQQWETPAYAVNPWTWAPIDVHPGERTYAISVFEVVYWHAHPGYEWRYGPSVPATGGAGAYCSFR
jgi:hypothetical protein